MRHYLAVQKLWIGFLSLVCLTNCSHTESNAAVLAVKPSTSKTWFTQVEREFPTANKKLRQWDAPVVADLDQDGYPDLLLNDHGFSIRVMWNNKGRYSKPYDLIMGDMHGISVADFDKDGLNEIILAPGGGSGSNARNAKIFRVSKDRQFTRVADFDTPLAYMRGRTVKFVDLNNDGLLDLIDFAFPSAEKKGESENYLYKNNQQQQLVLAARLPASQRDGQKVLLSDFNSDKQIDILVYGHGTVKAYENNGQFTFKNVSKHIFPSLYQHVSGIAEIDYDNDGDFDLLLTRGQEFKGGETFYHAASQTWGYYTKRGAFHFDNLVAGDVLNIINMQSQWPTKALYLGESAYEYQFAGETHSGRDIRLVNSDTLGFPDQLSSDKKGAYLGYVGNRTWHFATNTWSPSSGVIQGIESAPTPTQEPGFSNILLENRQGKFIDVSHKLPKQIAHTMGSAILDINNDGYQDIVLVMRGQMVTATHSPLLVNQQGAGFKLASNTGLISPELGAIGMGAQGVDYNLDGKMDIIQGNERGKWHLFKNQIVKSQLGAYIKVNVGESPKANASPLGALVKVTACANSQTQRVGATAAQYSQSYDKLVHFGLGSCQQALQLQVTWPNGEVANQKITSINQIINI
ncbi:CRTAC1 family protein [Saccharobesus litoralis]|uniref:CRTAC1 family protein n=1 Tax=Saccharobesus litoralis TaxID=2172099 RepID=A0A2S0VNE4_9ALTE|nr:CRTAC1 family protein [Saccharobesus litoralis]AWB65744.1 CRTAC1 family protein [Saccharobesus litoralis]